jgi:hypothetical protein
MAKYSAVSVLTYLNEDAIVNKQYALALSSFEVDKTLNKESIVLSCAFATTEKDNKMISKDVLIN